MKLLPHWISVCLPMRIFSLEQNPEADLELEGLCIVSAMGTLQDTPGRAEDDWTEDWMDMLPSGL